MAHEVLIVDDTEINLILFDALVKKIGETKSTTFSSASAGLAWAQTNDPDLVIVDYMMPELDGIEFIRRLRETPRQARCAYFDDHCQRPKTGSLSGA